MLALPLRLRCELDDSTRQASALPRAQHTPLSTPASSPGPSTPVKQDLHLSQEPLHPSQAPQHSVPGPYTLVPAPATIPVPGPYTCPRDPNLPFQAPQHPSQTLHPSQNHYTRPRHLNICHRTLHLSQGTSTPGSSPQHLSRISAVWPCRHQHLSQRTLPVPGPYTRPRALNTTRPYIHPRNHYTRAPGT